MKHANAGQDGSGSDFKYPTSYSAGARETRKGLTLSCPWYMTICDDSPVII